jgi:broad specificity phosphatase PhoE
MRSHRLLVAAALVLSATACGTAPAAHAGASVVYLVRHAEKVDRYLTDPSDPPLTDAGRERAEALARTLADAGVTRILASDFRRTRATAAPLAAALGLEVELYDPGALTELLPRLTATPGRVLVVGHSNTTPRLAELLGGDPGPPIDEAGEYDRLYVLVLGEDGGATTVRLHYGELAGGGARR